jgi:hypothetical protein
MEDLPLVAAGRQVPHAIDRIRRYCGLSWSGGSPETWAWQFYDTVDMGDPDRLEKVDVLAAGALHPGLARGDLVYFHERAGQVDRWLSSLPADLKLSDASDEVVEHVASLPVALPDTPLSLLTKVLHRKRPHLVPLLDRHVIDWYRPVTGQRAAVDAWGPLVRAMRNDLAESHVRLTMSIAVNGIEQELWPERDPETRPRLSWIRAVDIAIWMGTR